MYRYILSDNTQADNTPHFRFLKDLADFHEEKTPSMVSFGHALEQLARSDASGKTNLSDLFQRLAFDDFDKLLFSFPLLTCPQREIVEQGEERNVRYWQGVRFTNFIITTLLMKAQTICSNVLQPAMTQLSQIDSLSDAVLEYLFDSITAALSQDTQHRFDLDQIQQLVNIGRKRSQNNAICQGIQVLLDMKSKGQKDATSMNSDQFKARIIEMYNSNPASVTRILELAKEMEVRFEQTCV